MRAMLLAVLAVSVLAGAAACSSTSDTPVFPQVVSLGKGEIFPSIVNSTLAAGQNRVSMKLTDRDENKVLDANVHVRYYNLNGGKTTFRSEADARFIPIQLSYVDEQSGTNATVNTGEDGVYVSHVDFNEGGDWGSRSRSNAAASGSTPSRTVSRCSTSPSSRRWATRRRRACRWCLPTSPATRRSIRPPRLARRCTR